MNLYTSNYREKERERERESESETDGASASATLSSGDCRRTELAAAGGAAYPFKVTERHQSYQTLQT